MIEKYLTILGTILVGSVLLVFVAVLVVAGFAIALLAVPFMMIWEAFNPKYDAKNMDEYQGLIAALREGDIPFLETYAASVPEFPNCNDHFIGRSWLMNAIDEGTVGSVQWILDKGAQFEGYNDEGRSPLTAAIERETDGAQMVALLLDRGADPNAQGTMENPLHIAAIWGSLDTVKLLLDHGADPLKRDLEYSSERPVDYARRTRRAEVRTLLEDVTAAVEAAQPQQNG